MPERPSPRGVVAEAAEAAAGRTARRTAERTANRRSELRAISAILERQRLETLQRLDQLASEVASIVTAADGSNGDDEHDPEGATVAFERARAAALQDAAALDLAEVEAALGRLAGVCFGRCECCGCEVGAERLAALATTRTCVRCARIRSARTVGRRGPWASRSAQR